MVGRVELNDDAIKMVSSTIFSTRNDTNWSTTSTSYRYPQQPHRLTPNNNNNNNNFVSKSPFPNSNPNRNPNSFSKKQLPRKIKNGVVNELISGDTTSFNQINRRNLAGNVDDDVRVSGSFSRYVRYDVSGFSKAELNNLRLQLVSELDKVRTLSGRIELNKKRSSPFPTSNVNKEQKRPDTNGNHQVAQSYVASAQVMKMCATVLRKLSSQKAGIWFNSPVDAVSMGLHDYHTVINRPMDLGTIKAKLERWVYDTPETFADDVRLTFNNALRYNPKGHEVHTFAAQYLALFERWFVPIFTKFNSEKQYHFHQLGRRNSLPLSKPVRDDLPVVLDGSFTKLPSPEPPKMVNPVKKPDVKPRQEPVVMVERLERRGRPPERKLPKPKAKEVNKRGMSMEEKQKLGTGLQDLPEEKMLQLVDIIRKRNENLQQDGDEIELDIEALDNETLWELDRFLTNHKKSVSKIKKEGLIPPLNHNVGLFDDSSQAGMSEMMVEMSMKAKRGGGGVGDVMEEDVDIGGDEMPINNFPPLEIDKVDDRPLQRGGGSSSSGSSSSDDSSSSGSDTGSSSGSDSDVDDAQSCDKESKNFPH